LNGSINLELGRNAVRMPNMKEHYRTFAGYNEWANRRLYDGCGATVSDAEYRADRGAFFKSMHGTLNHLLATDRIWMKRFTGDVMRRTGSIRILCDEAFDAPACGARGRGSPYRGRGSRILDEARLAGVIRYRRVSSARGIRAGADAGAGSLVQPPDPSSRSGPCDPYQPRQSRPGAGHALLSTPGGCRHGYLSSQTERPLPDPGQRESQTASTSPRVP
jgi:hypothetical protein